MIPRKGRIEVRAVGLQHRAHPGATGPRRGLMIPRGCGHNFAFVGLCTRSGHRGPAARVGMLWLLLLLISPCGRSVGQARAYVYAAASGIFLTTRKIGGGSYV